MATKNCLTAGSKRLRNKKQVEVDLAFKAFLEKRDRTDIFAPPKSPKSLLWPAN